MTGTEGEPWLSAVAVNGERVPADLLLVSGGWNPAVHLWSHVKGTTRFDPDLAQKEAQLLTAARGTQKPAKEAPPAQKDPKTAPMLKEMLGPDGAPRVCDRVWITYISPDRGETEKNGKLTAGFGANSDDIGPEFTFGIYIEKLLGEPVLLIKTAWGGKSINTDFRPPGAGAYEFNETQLENFKKQGKDLAAEKAKKAEATGRYYREMIAHDGLVVAQAIGDQAAQVVSRLGLHAGGDFFGEKFDQQFRHGRRLPRDRCLVTPNENATPNEQPRLYRRGSLRIQAALVPRLPSLVGPRTAE